MMMSREIFVPDSCTEKMPPLQKGQVFLLPYFVIICLFYRSGHLVYRGRLGHLLRNYKFLLIIFPIICAAAAQASDQAPLHELTQTVILPPNQKVMVNEMILVGNDRTQRQWVLDFLDLDLPLPLSESNCLEMSRKLMTTQVFQLATVELQSINNSDSHLILITLREKWTIIPVVRGGVGGGDNYKYVGVYDTHAFGSLWTLGAEAHQFGRQPTGGVVWARAPRFNGGREVLGLELWREHRQRLYFKENAEKPGARIYTDLSKIRLLYLRPAFGDQQGGIKSGLDLTLSKEAPPKINRETGYRDSLSRLDYPAAEVQSTQALWRTEIDDLFLDRHFGQGKRLIFSLGPEFESNKVYPTFEADLYFFHRYLSRENLGIHVFVGDKGSLTAENQYYLGGLESVRGIPDGYVFGRKAFYANIENRHLILEETYIDIMSVLFFDIGNAADSWDRVSQDRQTAVGLGLRFSVPQIYRLSFRIDYAFSLNNPKNHGVSAGMNHFFQPHKPL